MTVRFAEMAPYQGAATCTGSVTPGARALMAYWLEQFEPLAKSMGIYNCRSVRGGSTTSLHGEGRACDCGIPVTDEGHAVMYRFLELLAPHAKRLGIQYVIFNRVQWSAIRPAEGAYYGGVHPHRDHAHIELSWNAARNLTLATLRAVLGDFRGLEDEEPEVTPVAPVAPKPTAPRPTSVPTRLTRRGGEGLAVGIDQGLLLAHGHGPVGLVTRSGIPDRSFGPSTDKAVRDFQRRHNLVVDGVVGQQTRTRLLAPLGTSLPLQRGDKGGAVGRMQGLLLAWGYGPKGLVARHGRPDRDAGPTTDRLIRAFQRDRGLVVDGVFGPKSYAAALRL